MAEPCNWKVAVIGAGFLGTRIAGEYMARYKLGVAYLAIRTGELALLGCTVHIFDHDSLKLQTIHSIISDHLQQLKEQGLISEGHQLQVSGRKLIAQCHSQGKVIHMDLHRTRHDHTPDKINISRQQYQYSLPHPETSR